MWHTNSVRRFLTDQPLAAEAVQAIEARMATAANERGWLLNDKLDEVIGDQTLAQAYQEAWGKDAGLREQARVISVVIADVPGALARVVSLFSGRGYNIDELTVARAKSAKYGINGLGGVSRITITTICSDTIIAQIVAQIGKIVDVKEILDLSDNPAHARARITLVRVHVSLSERRSQALQHATLSFRAKCTRTKPDSLIFRFAGSQDATDAFISEMRTFGEVETASSGLTAIL